MSLQALVICGETVASLVATLFDSFSGRIRFAQFLQYLITFCSRPEAACSVISGQCVVSVALGKPAKFHDPILNRSREMPPEADVGGIFRLFSPITSDRK